jgi:hypothetical protein
MRSYPNLTLSCAAESFFQTTQQFGSHPGLPVFRFHRHRQNPRLIARQFARKMQSLSTYPQNEPDHNAIFSGNEAELLPEIRIEKYAGFQSVRRDNIGGKIPIPDLRQFLNIFTLKMLQAHLVFRLYQP